MVYKIVTKDSGVFTAQDTVSDVGEEFTGEYVYYVFLAKQLQYANTNDVVVASYDNEDMRRQVYGDMLFGKRVKTADASLVVPRYNYTSDAVYDAYDDKDTDLFNKKFFVTVKRGSSYDVFKCLDNNNGANSTQPPNFTETSADDEIYRTSDNYVWKYMYTISGSTFNKFATEKFIPVVPNANVTGNAVSGSIDVIKVDASGEGYNNYLAGKISSSDLNIDGSEFKLSISGNNKVSADSGFYTGCVFKLTSGAKAGDYATITGYVANSTTNIVTLDKALDPPINSDYIISPGVTITGDLLETSNAYARAVINTVANTVDYIEMLERGAGYRQATASVVANSVVKIKSAAVVRPIMSPFGGHGHNANSELGASRACFSVTFDDIGDDFPPGNDFRQVGIMTNPRFAEVTVDLASKDGTFIADETIYKISPKRVFGSSITVNSTSAIVTGTDTDFERTFTAGDFVYLTGSSIKQLTKVASVANSTQMTLTTNGAFACTDTQVYYTDVRGEAKVVSDETSSIVLTDVYWPYANGDEVVGFNSGAYGVVNSISVGGVATTLDKFIQMNRYEIATTGTYTPDEVVYDTSTGYNKNRARVFSVTGTAPKVMYVTNQYGTVNIGGELYGNSSQASASVTGKYQPDLSYNSGRIIYLENLEPVSRPNGQKETFKIVFEY